LANVQKGEKMNKHKEQEEKDIEEIRYCKSALKLLKELGDLYEQEWEQKERLDQMRKGL